MCASRTSSPLHDYRRLSVSCARCTASARIDVPLDRIVLAASRGERVHVIAEDADGRRMGARKFAYACFRLAVVCICRRGNDSQLAVVHLRNMYGAGESRARFRDVIGGLEAYTREVDARLPHY